MDFSAWGHVLHVQMVQERTFSNRRRHYGILQQPTKRKWGHGYKRYKRVRTIPRKRLGARIITAEGKDLGNYQKSKQERRVMFYKYVCALLLIIAVLLIMTSKWGRKNERWTKRESPKRWKPSIYAWGGDGGYDRGACLDGICYMGADICNIRRI